MSKVLTLVLVLVCGQVQAGVMCLEWQFPPCEQPCEQAATQEGCPVCAGGLPAPGTLFGPPLLAPLIGLGALAGGAFDRDRGRDGGFVGGTPFLPENPGWGGPGGPGTGGNGGSNPGGGNGGETPVVPEPSSVAIWAVLGLLLVWQVRRGKVACN